MSFRLVPNSVTVDDLQRLNSPNRRVISTNSVAFGAHYVKLVEDTLILSAAIYHLWRYWQGITPSESLKLRHSALASENLTELIIRHNL